MKTNTKLKRSDSFTKKNYLEFIDCAHALRTVNNTGRGDFDTT